MLKLTALRTTSETDYYANLGDNLINIGVEDIVRSTYKEIEISWVNRCDPAVLEEPADNSHIDVLVYAGSPQFGARQHPTRAEQIWEKILLEKKHDFLKIINIGCGTSYSLLDSRVSVLLAMLKEPFNQQYYQNKNDVLYIARDRISWLFLKFMGLNAVLQICPSAFAVKYNIQHVKKYRIALVVLPPSSQFTQHELKNIGFDLDHFYKKLIQLYPDIIVIGNVQSDESYIKSLGAKHTLVARNATDLISIHNLSEYLISLRVHGTVPALLNGANVLHIGVDGRSDLLTPYMAYGLMKVNLFSLGSLDNLLDIVATFLEVGHTFNFADMIEIEKNNILKIINAADDSNFKTLGYRNIIVNPTDIVKVSETTIIIYPWNRFLYSNQSFFDRSQQLHRVIACEGHNIYGPYINIPMGRYQVNFDFEFWGYVSNPEVRFIFDVYDSSSQISSCQESLSIRELLVQRNIQLDFQSTDCRSNFEFRIKIINSDTSLYFNFNGVFLLLLS